MAVAGALVASGGISKCWRSASRDQKGRKKGRKSIGDEDDEDTEYKGEDEEDDDDP